MTICSITAHESPEVLVDQCQNFLYFNPFLTIIIHLNKEARPMFEKSTKLQAFLEQNPQVIINPESLSTSVYSFTHTKAHLSNVILARELFTNCETIIFHASNSLYLKNGLESLTKAFSSSCALYSETGEFSIAADFGFWKLEESFYSKLPKSAIKYGLIEGSFYDFRKFNSVVDFILELPDSYFSGAKAWEEILFASIYFYLFPDLSNHSFSNCEGMFLRELTTGFIEQVINTPFDTIEVCKPKTPLERFEYRHKNPSKTYEDFASSWLSIKRVAREYNNPIRTYIRDRFNNYDSSTNI